MSNTEYPKMLYTGDKVNYSCRAVQDADEEQQYRENGLVDYADLDEPAPKNTGAAQGGGVGGEEPQGFITTEQFDAVAERLAAAETEIERLKQAATNGVSADLDEPVDFIDYTSLTSDQLRALLDEKGITYLARDNKETLINLLG